MNFKEVNAATPEELVNIILKEELEYLRKRIFPYKRRELLNKEVILCVKNLDEYTAGNYTNTKDKDNDNYKHIINISYKQVIKCINNNNEGLRFNIDNIRGTIRHELIHAFCQEEYEDWDIIKGTLYDSSFIFLSVLTWVCGRSCHESVRRSWYGSDLEIDALSYINYEDLRGDLIRYIIKVEKVIKSITADFDGNTNKQFENNKTKIYYPTLQISLGENNEGISKLNHKKERKLVVIDGVKKIVEVDSCTMRIGFKTSIDNLKYNILKKFYNDEFEMINSV